MSDPATIDLPTYYERLNNYFPEQELKHPRQLEDLVEQADVYRKLEEEEYLLLYAEFANFIFVDYLLVNPAIRGKGTGSKVMKRLQATGKAIVLEVEPENPSEPDTILRRKFYARHGFKEAQGVLYRRKDPHGVPFDMDILVWTPGSSSEVDDELTLDMMSEVCEHVHNYRAKDYYGRLPADPAKVLALQVELVN